MATLKEIAKETGVSVAATSMAIRDYGVIGDETERRIWEALLKLGYSPRLRCSPRSREDS
jgi:DNA-binding LacI/PurR family transcriptional regulator